MRVLVVTGLFPSRAAPAQGVFLRHRVRALANEGAEVRVVAPVPWAPPLPGLPARYARFRATPPQEEIDGLPVRHPRYLMVPKVGMVLQDRAYARAIAPVLAEERARFRPEVVDVHYLYPDACAVARVAPRLGVPYVCTARGSDVKRLGRIPVVARRVRAALGRAAGVVAVSRDLAGTMRALDLHDGDVRVIPNGVDPLRFRPRDRAEARRRLRLPERGRAVVCVGHVADVHGQDLLVEALAHPEAPPDLHAYLVGGGEGLEPLRRRARALGLAGRVHFVGPVAHETVPLWFAAADASVHPGRWAGCPNAVLESLACGIPCLASDLPEMREVIASERQGRVVPRTPEAFARGLRHLLERPSGGVPRAPRTWSDVGREALAFLQECVAERSPASARR